MKDDKEESIVKGDKEERWMGICSQIALEQDSKRLMELITELNRLLDENRNGPSSPNHRAASGLPRPDIAMSVTASAAVVVKSEQARANADDQEPSREDQNTGTVQLSPSVGLHGRSDPSTGS